jgi:hypothetical protein
MATYQKIASTVLGSSQNTIVFSSIPQTYTDLVIKGNARYVSNSGGVVSNLDMYFNNASGNGNYGYVQMRSSDSALIPVVQNSNNAKWDINSWINDNNSNASMYSNFEFYIPRYAGGYYRTMYGCSGGITDGSTKGFITWGGFQWSNTSAITSITLNGTAYGGFATNSSFYLYGISKS